MISSVLLTPATPAAVQPDAACCANVATPQTHPKSAIRTLTNSLYAALRRRAKVMASTKSFLTQS